MMTMSKRVPLSRDIVVLLAAALFLLVRCVALGQTNAPPSDATVEHLSSALLSSNQLVGVFAVDSISEFAAITSAFPSISTKAEWRMLSQNRVDSLRLISGASNVPLRVLVVSTHSSRSEPPPSRAFDEWKRLSNYRRSRANPVLLPDTEWLLVLDRNPDYSEVSPDNRGFIESNVTFGVVTERGAALCTRWSSLLTPLLDPSMENILLENPAIGTDLTNLTAMVEDAALWTNRTELAVRRGALQTETARRIVDKVEQLKARPWFGAEETVRRRANCPPDYEWEY